MTTRENLIEITAKLIREKGVNGLGINEILSKAGVPKGSLYHHFPGGKDELVIEALHQYKDWMSGNLKQAMKGKQGALAGLEAMIDMFATNLTKSHYVSGCPLATVALETAGINENLANACREVMEYWVDQLESYLTYKGICIGRENVFDFITRLEGAMLMSRIYKHTAALDRLKEQIKDLFHE